MPIETIVLVCCNRTNRACPRSDEVAQTLRGPKTGGVATPVKALKAVQRVHGNTRGNIGFAFHVKQSELDLECE